MSTRLELEHAADARLIVTALRVAGGAIPADRREEERSRCLRLAYEISIGLLQLEQNARVTAIIRRPARRSQPRTGGTASDVLTGQCPEPLPQARSSQAPAASRGRPAQQRLDVAVADECGRSAPHAHIELPHRPDDTHDPISGVPRRRLITEGETPT